MTMFEYIDNPDIEKNVRNFSHTVQLGSLASCLALARSGVDFSDRDVSRIINELADLREQWKINVDDVNNALIQNEPELAKEWRV